MFVWTEYLAFIAAAQVLFLVAMYSRYARQLPVFPWLSMVAAGSVAYLILPIARAHGAPGWLLLCLGLVQTSTAFFFWLAARTIIQRRFRPGWKEWLLLVCLLGALVTSFWPGRPFFIVTAAEQDRELLRRLPVFFLAMLFLAAGVREILAGWRGDLLEGRRRWCRAFLLAGGMALVFFPLVRLVFLSPALLPVGMALSGLAALAMSTAASFLLLQPVRELLDPEAEAPGAIVDPQLLSRLLALFQIERVYREEGLTITQVARRLGVPEYRARQAVRVGLGQRNFNDYLNQCRIQEAAERLLAEPTTSIVRIAMDVGYRSLAGFNKAFKAGTGRTPSEFRAEGRE